MKTQGGDWVELFDGHSLAGWRAIPRIFEGLGPGHTTPDEPHDRRHRQLATKNLATWTVESGAIVGRQQTPGGGYGGYLITEQRFSDFELELEARPDWPADTGIYLRATGNAARAYQVLLDHRPSGALAGFYGNGLGGFHAVAFTVDEALDDSGRVVGLRAEDPESSFEPATAAKRSLLRSAADPDDLLQRWSWNGWNHYRIRCVGRHPLIQVWINGLLAAELDTASMPPDVYNAAGVEDLIEGSGHIALEVHDNDLYVASGFDPADVTFLGPERWGRGAACRWRNLRVRSLDPDPSTKPVGRG